MTARLRVDASFRLRTARLVAGYWSAASAAKTMEVSASTYTAAESGRRKPPEAILMKASQAFGVSIDYLQHGIVAFAGDNFARRVENILAEKMASPGAVHYAKPHVVHRPMMAQIGERDENARLSSRLRAARIEAHFTSAKDAARYLHLPSATYSAHESGAQTPGLMDLVLYAGAFGCSPEFLIVGDLYRREEQWMVAVAKRHGRGTVAPPLRLVSIRYAEILDGSVRILSGPTHLPLEALLQLQSAQDNKGVSTPIYEESELLGILHKALRGNVVSTLIVDSYFPISRRFDQVLVSDGDVVSVVPRNELIDGRKAADLPPFNSSDIRRRQPFAIGGYVTTMVFAPTSAKELLNRFPPR